MHAAANLTDIYYHYPDQLPPEEVAKHLERRQHYEQMWDGEHA